MNLLAQTKLTKLSKEDMNKCPIAHELAKKQKNELSNGLFLKKSLKKYIKLTDKALKNEFRTLRLAYKIMANSRFYIELVKWCQTDEKLKKNIFESLFGDKPSISFKFAIISKFIKFKLKKKRV